jgi:tetratricopeptide (TPR) repeat protein
MRDRWFTGITEHPSFSNQIIFITAEKIRSLLSAAIASFPDSWEAYDAMGETYIERGDKGQAIESFKKAVELNPQDTNAIEVLKKLEGK